MQRFLTLANLLRTPLFIVADLLALLLYLAGLLSPLTPSSGSPAVGDYLVFLVIPLLIMLLCAAGSRSRPGRLFFLAQALLAGSLVVWLVRWS